MLKHVGFLNQMSEMNQNEKTLIFAPKSKIFVRKSVKKFYFEGGFPMFRTLMRIHKE